jgi:hypothetical protein
MNIYRDGDCWYIILNGGRHYGPIPKPKFSIGGLHDDDGTHIGVIYYLELGNGSVYMYPEVCDSPRSSNEHYSG